jgi:tRNA pseudouridine55 synthase
MPRGIKPGTRPLAGIVLVDKPAGFTSNRVLQQTKRLFRAQKAGHTGTLDPMATGMLPICFGAATRVSGLMLEASKRYRVTARFGIATDTGDASGTETERSDAQAPSTGDIECRVVGLTGRILQVPPMYSALKHQGRRLYELAREGKEVPRAAREVDIHELTIETLDWPYLTLSVHCSKGTYVRTLVTDLAAALGTVAHVAALRRLAVGLYEESQMVGLETLEQAEAEGFEVLDRCLLGIDTALTDRPAITVSEADSDALRYGRRVMLTPQSPVESVRLYDPGGGFIGLGEVAASGELKPAQIFPV